jgi:hypothetical protein
MFDPRSSRKKRSHALPQVRVDEEELAAVRWMTEHLRQRDGESYSVSDVLRMALASYYSSLGGPAKPASPTP